VNDLSKKQRAVAFGSSLAVDGDGLWGLKDDLERTVAVGSAAKEIYRIEGSRSSRRHQKQSAGSKGR
jgi:hypothetical protein